MSNEKKPQIQPEQVTGVKTFFLSADNLANQRITIQQYRHLISLNKLESTGNILGEVWKEENSQALTNRLTVYQANDMIHLLESGKDVTVK